MITRRQVLAGAAAAAVVAVVPGVAQAHHKPGHGPPTLPPQSRHMGLGVRPLGLMPLGSV